MTATIILSGKLSKTMHPNDLDQFFSGLQLKHRLDSVNVLPDSVELVGSPKHIMSAIFDMSYEDVMVIYYNKVHSPPSSSHKFSSDSIRRELRKAKSERFSKRLLKHDLPLCYGNMPWLFITPKTTKAHEEGILRRMDDCIGCPHQWLCGIMSILRVMKETTLNGN